MTLGIVLAGLTYAQMSCELSEHKCRGKADDVLGDLAREKVVVLHRIPVSYVWLRETPMDPRPSRDGVRPRPAR